MGTQDSVGLSFTIWKGGIWTWWWPGFFSSCVSAPPWRALVASCSEAESKAGNWVSTAANAAGEGVGGGRKRVRPVPTCAPLLGQGSSWRCSWAPGRWAPVLLSLAHPGRGWAWLLGSGVTPASAGLLSGSWSSSKETLEFLLLKKHHFAFELSSLYCMAWVIFDYS